MFNLLLLLAIFVNVDEDNITVKADKPEEGYYSNCWLEHEDVLYRKFKKTDDYTWVFPKEMEYGKAVVIHCTDEYCEMLQQEFGPSINYVWIILGLILIYIVIRIFRSMHRKNQKFT